MNAPLRLQPLDTALQAWRALVGGPVAPLQVAPEEAIGAVLAADLVAAAALPPQPRARLDGWAVRAADTQGASDYAPVALAAPVWLDSGAPLPAGADAVLPPFDLGTLAGQPCALAPVAPGDGVAARGRDLPAQAMWRRAGQPVRARDALALQALGAASVPVRRPGIGWITVRPAKSAHTALWSRTVQACGAGLTHVQLAATDRQDPQRLAAALAAAAPQVDLLVVAGGTGAGRNDPAAAALADAGTLALHGVALRPGTSAGFGSVAGRPVLLLPGALDDALAAWITFGRAALASLTAATPRAPRRAALARRITSAVGLADLVPVRHDPEGRLEPLAVAALPLSALLQADGFVLIPAASEGCDAGATLEWLPLDDPCA